MAKETTERRFKTVHETPQQIKLGVHQGFEGEYIGAEHITGTDDAGKPFDFQQYSFQGEDGRYVLNGSYQLDNAMRAVESGAYVRITRLPSIPIRGGAQEMSSYRVEVAE